MHGWTLKYYVKNGELVIFFKHGICPDFSLCMGGRLGLGLDDGRGWSADAGADFRPDLPGRWHESPGSASHQRLFLERGGHPDDGGEYDVRQ